MELNKPHRLTEFTHQCIHVSVISAPACGRGCFFAAGLFNYNLTLNPWFPHDIHNSNCSVSHFRNLLDNSLFE